jgi:hypothetical protein
VEQGIFSPEDWFLAEWRGKYLVHAQAGQDRAPYRRSEYLCLEFKNKAKGIDIERLSGHPGNDSLRLIRYRLIMLIHLAEGLRVVFLVADRAF